MCMYVCVSVVVVGGGASGNNSDETVEMGFHTADFNVAQRLPLFFNSTDDSGSQTCQQMLLVRLSPSDNIVGFRFAD